MSKRELGEILKNKKFMISFFLQTILLLSLLPAFGNLFSEGNLALPAPTLKGFTPVGVVIESDSSEILLDSLGSNERLKLYFFSEPPVNEIENGIISAYLIIPPDYREDDFSEGTIYLALARGIKSPSALSAVEQSIREAERRLSRKRQELVGIDFDSPVIIKREYLKPVVVERGNEQFSSFFLAYLIPLILFFPLFTSGGLVLDSFVGEKDRKTIEALIASPLNRYEIFSGKFLALWLFITGESVLWILGITLLGIPLGKPLEALITLMALNALVISIAAVLAIYSRNLKEANIALMLFYIPIFIVILYSLTIEFLFPRDFFSYLPFNLVSRAVSGEAFSYGIFAVLVILMSTFSLGAVAIGSRLMGRDDIIFGPRPGILLLVEDWVHWSMSRYRIFGGMMAILVFSPFLFLIAAFIQGAMAVFIIWSLGYSSSVLFLLIILFASLEEVLKVIPIFLMMKRPQLWMKAPVILLLAGVAGLGFFLVESLPGAIGSLLFRVPFSDILVHRFSSTIFMHILASSLAGLGLYYRGPRGFVLFLLAILLHVSFNIAVTGAGL